MITLLPVAPSLARAVLDAADLGTLLHVADWPTADDLDALRMLADHPEHAGPGTFLVRQDGVVVGSCGWFGPPDDSGAVLIGYGLAPSARRKGYGTAAIRLLLEWVARQGATRVRADVLPGNEPSLRLLAGLGFQVTGQDNDYVVLERLITTP